MKDSKVRECRMVEWSEENVGYLLQDVYGVTELGGPIPPSTGPPNSGHIRSVIDAYFACYIQHNRR